MNKKSKQKAEEGKEKAGRGKKRRKEGKEGRGEREKFKENVNEGIVEIIFV
ncbi:MAG: hypothetical protein HDS71_00645 [Bacteroidales bacterium]|nr:hypothetical protein [Bacteroidales bacterium]MBD5222555.1 hypothetical protein [Bacteroidales bacterium]